jgi:two-component system sensor histidine kinase KdpD
MACLVLTAAAYPLADQLDHANVVMAYLLAVAVIALLLGRSSAILAAMASVLLFDFFFVSPRFSFAVDDAQYVITFGVMLAVALIIGTLTARLRDEANAAMAREAETRALYGLAQKLSGALHVETVAASVASFVHEQFAGQAVLLLPGGHAGLNPVNLADAPGIDPAVPTKAFETATPRPFVNWRNGTPALALPLLVGSRTRGVLVILTPGRASFDPHQRPLIDAVATLTGIVIERLHYEDVAQEATVQAESERLRNSLLSAVSHDLRTPLTVLVGHADALANARPPLSPGHAETAVIMRDEALRMTRMVSNLLEMARLQAGRVVLRKEWQPLEDVVLTSVRAIEAVVPAERKVSIELPDDLPLVEFDAILIERVITNLLDNAARHGRGGIGVGAAVKGNTVEVVVTDHGAGLPPGTEASVFRRFEQGARAGHREGGGMGLAICKAIVEAHGGTIGAANQPAGGARFAFALPLGRPPRPAADGAEPLSGMPAP